MTTLNLTTEQTIESFEGHRVRVILNRYQTKAPKGCWYVYPINQNKPMFATRNLVLNFAATYGELKPKFAPHGAPSFVGVIGRHIPDINRGHRLNVHPYAPAKLFTTTTIIDNVEAFTACKYLFLDGPEMYACDHLLGD